MEEFQTSDIMGLLTSSAMMFGHHSINSSIKFYKLQPYIVSHVTRTKKPQNSNMLHFSQLNHIQQLKIILIKKLFVA